MQITSPGKLRFSYCVEYPSYDSYSKFYVERLQLVNNLWQPISTSVFESGVTVLLSPTTDFSVRYPATLSESIPTVVAVGASTDWDYRSDLSRYGGNALTFVAPGGSGYRDILTTDRTAGGYNMLPILNFADANYTWFKGTSAAAPLAASVAALVLSRNGHLTATSIKSILINACDKVHQADGKLAYDVSGRNEFVGYGRVNANSAVNAVTADIVAPQFSGAYVQTTRTIDLVFNEPMGGGIYTPLSFTISGAGKGTLANNPSQVIRLAPEKYRLVWNTGGMVAGTVTISTSGLKDVAGNALASPTSRDSTGTKAIELVNCGGSTVFPFGSGDPRTPWLAEDTGWVGNTRMLYTTSGYGNYTMNSVNTSEVTSPAPTGVYQTARAMYYNTGWATYTLKNVLPNETVKVRLHFNEFYGWSNAGDQIFHIRINNSNPGTYPDLPNYDIMNYTGVQMNKADIREFTITNGSGPMVIQLQPDQGWTGYYNWTLNGIEVMRP